MSLKRMYNYQDCTMQVHASACRERSNSSFAPTAEPATSPASSSFGSQHTAQIPLWEPKVAVTAYLPFPERSFKVSFLKKDFQTAIEGTCWITNLNEQLLSAGICLTWGCSYNYRCPLQCT